MLTALKEEEEQKSLRMKEKIDRLTEEITSLIETIKTTEEAIAYEDFEFLKVKMMRFDVSSLLHSGFIEITFLQMIRKR